MSAQLTEDVLDVTRIEIDSLQLNKDEFTIKQVLLQPRWWLKIN
jgi:hypothetical protein